MTSGDLAWPPTSECLSREFWIVGFANKGTADAVSFLVLKADNTLMDRLDLVLADTMLPLLAAEIGDTSASESLRIGLATAPLRNRFGGTSSRACRRCGQCGSDKERHGEFSGLHGETWGCCVVVVVAAFRMWWGDVDLADDVAVEDGVLICPISNSINRNSSIDGLWTGSDIHSITGL